MSLIKLARKDMDMAAQRLSDAVPTNAPAAQSSGILSFLKNNKMKLGLGAVAAASGYALLKSKQKQQQQQQQIF